MYQSLSPPATHWKRVTHSTTARAKVVPKDHSAEVRLPRLRIAALVLAVVILRRNIFDAMVLLWLAHYPGTRGRSSAVEFADTIILPPLLIIVLTGFAFDPRLWRRADGRKVKAGRMPARLESAVN